MACLPIVAAVLVLLPGGQVSSFDKTETGNGTLLSSGQTLSVSRVRLNVRADQTFDVQVTYSNTTLNGSGKWSPGVGKLALTFTRWEGLDATGSGTVDMFDNSKWSRIQFALNSPVKASVDFKPAWAGPKFRLNREENGTGSIRSGNQNQADVSKVRVDLREDGSATVELKNTRTTRIRGTYTINGSTASVTVTELDGAAATGQIQVELSRDKRTFTACAFNVSRGGSSFTGSFKVVPNGQSLMRLSESGRGTWEWLGYESEEVSGVIVETFSPDKVTFTFTVNGRTRKLEGTFRKVSETRLDINVTSVPGQGSISRGTGYVQFTDSVPRRIQTVSLGGTFDTQPLVIEFDRR